METSVDNLYAFWVNHVCWLSRFAQHLDQSKGDDAAVDDLFVLSGVVLLVGQKCLKEGPEPDGMSTHHNVLFLDGRGKDEIAKIPHALQSVRAYRFVAGVEAHVDLVHKGGLKVADFRFLVDPRGLDLRLGRRDRERIGVPADLLQGWQDEDPFLRSALEAILEPTGDGRDGPPQAGGHQFGGRCIRLGHQYCDVLGCRIGVVKVFG